MGKKPHNHLLKRKSKHIREPQTVLYHSKESGDRVRPNKRRQGISIYMLSSGLHACYALVGTRVLSLWDWGEVRKEFRSTHSQSLTLN